MSLGARRRRPPTPGFVANDLWRRAGEVPSFHIAPARTQNATDLITGSVLGTYNSASPAWAVGPDGVLFQPAANAPVIEYDPVTLQCLGARIWGAVTNLLPRSEELGNAAWNRIAATVSSDVMTSPMGTQNADKLIETTANTEHILYQGRNAQNETVTFSIFAKASERSRIRIGFSNFSTAACGAIFNLNTGAVISTDAANPDYTSPTASIFAYPAGWYRCVFTVTKGTVNNTNNPFVNIVNNSNQFIYAGDGTSGLFAVGAQVNTGPLAPYVPTTATTASSTADVWTITGADFSRIINQTECTIYIEYGPHDATTPASNNSLFTIATSTTSAANIIEAFAGANIAPVFRVESNSLNQAYITSLAYSPSAIHKLAAAYKVDDFARSIDAQSIGTDTSGALPAVAPSILEIGTRNFGGVKPLNGYIREFAVLRSRRPNANLQAMAS